MLFSGSFSQLNNSLTASDGTHFRFGKDEDGKYGYIITDEAGADTVIPFKSNTSSDAKLIVPTENGSVMYTCDGTWSECYFFIGYIGYKSVKHNGTTIGKATKVFDNGNLTALYYWYVKNIHAGDTIEFTGIGAGITDSRPAILFL